MLSYRKYLCVKFLSVHLHGNRVADIVLLLVDVRTFRQTVSVQRQRLSVLVQHRHGLGLVFRLHGHFALVIPALEAVQTARRVSVYRVLPFIYVAVVILPLAADIHGVREAVE